ncbi:flavin monoamine oxidase family protein [Thalassolituus sp.]|uniref:flavin monoamine oxidase family protein n=1 Tax=Thalassolituus sp. TaxID=2030822 RepID=UPI00243E4211|nr:FAD-dependent oxidoreductase [Pseudomonadota bacterium]MEC8102202.1 FAD-dependent oxidoreductase [Pseudomonadota bacterium]
MNHKQIAIVGGGLSGLYAAFLLEQQGITDYVLLEARSYFGGRILDYTDTKNDDLDRFDLGPTWIWPGLQPQLDALINNLGLEKFAQYDQGYMVVERSSNEPPITMRNFVNSPASMRLKGGMGSLIRAIYERLQSQELYVSARVKSIRNGSQMLEISYCDAQSDSEHTVNVDHVFLALPPRLAANRIQFIPPLPKTLTEQWQETATWMAPHAKYIAIYDVPFWREQGLSGDARSARGPMVEIHDASMPGGKAALFGFLGIPANYRKELGVEEIKVHCRAQMARLFGTDAENFAADAFKDWAQDEFTATEFDLNMTNQHGRTPDNTVMGGIWKNRMTGVGSEWSAQFPGYIAGAIEAATIGVKDYVERRSTL